MDWSEENQGMGKRKGRTIAMGSVVVGMLVLVGVGWAMRDRAIEQWYIWKLDSADFTERFRAAKKLGEVRSTKAIPALIGLLKESSGRVAEAREVWGSQIRGDNLMAKVFGQIGPPAVPALTRALEDTAGERGLYWRRYACRALGETKTGAAVRALIDRLDDRDTCVSLVALQTLGSMGPEAKEAIPALSRVVERQSAGTIHRTAASALAEIQATEAEAKAGD